MKFFKGDRTLRAATDAAIAAVSELRARCTAPLDEVIATMHRMGALELAIPEEEDALASQIRLLAKGLRDFPPFIDLASVVATLKETEANARRSAK